METKHEKYIVSAEYSENNPPITCSHDQEAHSSACWHPPSNDVTSDVSSNLVGVFVSPGDLAHSGYAQRTLSHTQVKGNCCSTWSLWKVFLACLLACVITTAIGVLIIFLLNDRGNNDPSIVIKIIPNNREPVANIDGTTPSTSQPTVTITSTEPTTRATLTESTTITTSTEPPIATSRTITSTKSTVSTPSTEFTTTTANFSTSSKTTAVPTSTGPTTAATSTTENSGSTLH
ncbi:PREDICTED: dynactin-associated protein-like [Hipposideros armiger]|uniref:Dynactin-associated protein-like n=1 Tax=Hipposideros armiger TaxID=186990 RepID=A0A8B7R675_HIPAR|nr:PREDICTED: dynactin-associated protein-like [Hipposideros armiger]